MCAVRRPMMAAGTRSTCETKSREMTSWRENSPPSSTKVRSSPTTGRESSVACPTRRFAPASRSSGREKPANPLIRARASSARPTSQLSSRGRRKAPVKNTRARCTTIAATNTSAAQ
jgi:hypothetical protein